MSASQEKRRRRELREEGVENNKSQAAKKKSYAQRKRNSIIQTVVIAVVVLLIIAVIVINSSLFYTALPAVNIGGTNYTTAQFNYYYYSSYYNFVSTYGDYVSYFGLDTTKPLGSQQYSETQTWEEYFEESALNTMRQTTLLYDEAMAAGFELSQESKDAVQASIDSLRTGYVDYGFSNLDQYVIASYGRGADIEMVEDLMTRSMIATEYSQQVVDSYEYTADELESYYREHADAFDYISYRQYFISGAADEEAGIDAAEAMTAAMDKAEEMARSCTSEDMFADFAYENAAEESKESYEDPDATLYRIQGQSLSSTYSEWLLSSERVYGECQYFESTNGYYVVMFVDRDDNHYTTRSVRHILIKAAADAEGAYTAEAKQAAYEEAERILQEWKDGEATEDSFAALAEQYSEDTGSSANGGLYENIYKGQMVPEFNDFCFADGAQYGDTGIVYGESSSYAGYHVMFYVGEGGQYSDYLAENSLMNEDYAAWMEAEVENYPADTKLSFRFTK